MHPPKGMMTKCQTSAVIHFVKNSPNVDFCASGVFEEHIMEKSGLPLRGVCPLTPYLFEVEIHIILLSFA